MDLPNLVKKLDETLFREIVSCNNDEILSFAGPSPKTVTINSTSYAQTNRLCLRIKESYIYLYISSYNAEKIVNMKISDINSISIT